MSAKIAVSSSITWLIGWMRPVSAGASRTGRVTSTVSVVSRASSAASFSAARRAASAAVDAVLEAVDRAGPAPCARPASSRRASSAARRPSPSCRARRRARLRAPPRRRRRRCAARSRSSAAMSDMAGLSSACRAARQRPVKSSGSSGAGRPAAGLARRRSCDGVRPPARPWPSRRSPGTPPARGWRGRTAPCGRP